MRTETAPGYGATPRSVARAAAAVGVDDFLVFRPVPLVQAEAVSRLPLHWVGLLADGALLALGLAALTAGWEQAESVGLVTVIVAPFAFAAVASTAAACAGLRPLLAARPSAERAFVARGAFALPTVAIVAGVGVYLSNRLLVDTPTGRLTCLAYVITLFLAITVGVAVWKLQCTEAIGRRCAEGGWERVVAVPLTLAAGSALAADSGLFPAERPAFHLAASGVALVCLAAALALFRVRSTLATQRDPRGRVVGGALGLALLTGLSQGGPDELVSAAAVAVRRPGLHARAVMVARRLLDADGDGFSAALGGGDCDDRDATRFPLAPGGRDCLASAPLEDQARPTLRAPAREPPPSTIVLLTGDALRCGLEGEERPELTGICPEIQRLGREGRSRLDVVAVQPTTRVSLSRMHIWREPTGEPRWLPALLRDHGYRTEAIITHPYAIGAPGLSGAYDRVDTSLQRLALAPNGLSSSQVTQHLLARAAPDRTRQRRFLWAHYFDAHDPYVSTPGSPWAAEALPSYIAEVRRVDAAIGLVAASARRGELGDDVVLLVTADHGEEHGEHGGNHHGLAVYRESIRIPFVAWRFRGGAVLPIEGELPGSGRDVAPFVAHLVGVETNAPLTDRTFSMEGPWDDQFGLSDGAWTLIYHRRLGYEELFDDRRDPQQRHDLSGQEQVQVQRMKARLVASFHEQAKLRDP